MTVRVNTDRERIARFCHEHHIRWLALFGSVLRDDFGPDSDIDVLVEFDADHVPGLLGLSRLAREMSNTVFEGRKIDLRTPEDLSRYFRQDVLAAAEVQYAA